jgi:hypothetical protein
MASTVVAEQTVQEWGNGLGVRIVQEHCRVAGHCGLQVTVGAGAIPGQLTCCAVWTVLMGSGWRFTHG